MLHAGRGTREAWRGHKGQGALRDGLVASVAGHGEPEGAWRNEAEGVARNSYHL